MKKILGLDLGVASIGWSLIEENGDSRKIIGMGSRVIPLNTDDKDEFSTGNAISKNQKRTLRRTQRKGYDRYQLRRTKLQKLLKENGMLPGAELVQLPSLELWGLRAKATSQPITLADLGRVLLHMNQKRGYKSSRADANLQKKDTEYVAEVKGRHQHIKSLNSTIGQYFFSELKENNYARLKQQVFPREAYLEEFDAICIEQQKHFPKVLTSVFINELKNETIFYQRKLKSQKGLVSICEFEGFWTEKKEGEKIKRFFVGPKVAPRSSPLFQVTKVWETINAITIKDKLNQPLLITLQQKQTIFQHLDVNGNLTEAKLLEILELKKQDGWVSNAQTERGWQGNLTKVELIKILGKEAKELQSQIELETVVDKSTGELLPDRKIIKSSFEHQPLYKLWHTIYSINDEVECANTLIKHFKFDDVTATKLARIDFTKSGFGNRSAKAMRKILPNLMDGMVYSEAAKRAGYNHSNSISREQTLKKNLLDIIPILSKNSLRQPIVEKILNQLINLINAILGEKQDWVTREERLNNQFEIRIELARELKQSKEERNEAFKAITKRDRENENIRKRITEDYAGLGVRATRNSVIKWRLFHEINNDESKLNAACIYCGQPFGISDALRGSSIDVEHIIPKSLLFDDSQSNKTLTHRKCNEDKRDMTAFDFMSTKGDERLSEYVERVNSLFKKGIIKKGKRDRFLMPATKIPNNFIERQLRETQYITKKAKEILEQISLNVWTTSGTITAYLRNKWGWDDVTMNLQLPKYRELGFTEYKEWQTHDGQKHKQEIIKDWTKRDDHRHHALDALVVACTKQNIIQKLNTLNARHTKAEMMAEIKEYRYKLSLLDNYVIAQKPFNTQQVEAAVEKILVSFKAGKKVASWGTRKIKKGGRKTVVQKGIVVPRGPLSEESVYGRIKTIEPHKSVKFLFENPNLIFKAYIKELVEARIAQHEGDTKKALISLKKEPIYLDEGKTKVLEYGTSYSTEIVIKKPVELLNEKQIKDVVDPVIRQKLQERIDQFGGKAKDAFRELDRNPIWFNDSKTIPIKRVRWFSGLEAVEPVSFNEKGEEIGFVKPGNNHHMAFYIDEKGNKQEHVCTFWHAVERKKFKLPVVIKNPKAVWDIILQLPKDSQLPQAFLEKLPYDNWTFIQSLQQNEMFILGIDKPNIDKAIQTNDSKFLGKHLYRVQKLSMKGNGQIDLWFRYHLETELNDSSEAKTSKRFFNAQSIGAFEKLNPIKVMINSIGQIKI